MIQDLILALFQDTDYDLMPETIFIRLNRGHVKIKHKSSDVQKALDEMVIAGILRQTDDGAYVKA